MTVKLTYIKRRLIDGQAMTQWITQHNIGKIVIIDDELDKDLFMQDVHKMRVPKGVNTVFCGVEAGVKAQQDGEFEDANTIIFFTRVSELKKAVDAGLKLEEVQVAGLGGGPGRKAVLNSITLDQKDLDDLLAVQAGGTSGKWFGFII